MRPDLRGFLAEIADLAVRADEAGYAPLANILLLIVRAAREAPSTHARLVNAAYLFMDTLDSVHRDRRHIARAPRHHEHQIGA